jgi:ABC-2 type transport system ATP-binding protein
MRQRVLLAAALLHNPDLLVLDEPFSGLDVNASLLFRALLGLFAAQGRMILFSTHRFDMVEKVCSRAVILSAGRLVAEHRVSRERDGHSDELEALFVRVTEQEDYRPIARRILDVTQHA